MIKIKGEKPSGKKTEGLNSGIIFKKLPNFPIKLLKRMDERVIIK
jgi:hypothetical protein